MSPDQSSTRNRLLALAPSSAFARLAQVLQPMELERGRRLCEPGDPTDTVVFPERGIISKVAVSPEGERVEAGLVGWEGFAPCEIMLGCCASAFSVNVQSGGEGWSIDADDLAAIARAEPEFDALLRRFLHVCMVQSAYTGLSNAVHSVNVRLARWILMCDDRSENLGMPLTHEFVSVMLAVRRPTVTTALHELEGEGLIRTERACITVRDRRRLEAFAADAYGRPEDEYRRLIGPIR